MIEIKIKTNEQEHKSTFEELDKAIDFIKTDAIAILKDQIRVK